MKTTASKSQSLFQRGKLRPTLTRPQAATVATLGTYRILRVKWALAICVVHVTACSESELELGASRQLEFSLAPNSRLSDHYGRHHPGFGTISEAAESHTERGNFSLHIGDHWKTYWKYIVHFTWNIVRKCIFQYVFQDKLKGTLKW
jgi:hypothetical protein